MRAGTAPQTPTSPLVLCLCPWDDPGLISMPVQGPWGVTVGSAQIVHVKPIF